MNAKSIVRKIHLILGFASGIVIFIVAVTGCLYAFKSEIESITEPWRNLTFQGEKVLIPSKLREIGFEILPGKDIHAVMYQESGKASKIIYYSEKDAYYITAYVNPYTGELIKIKDEFKGFFPFILNGHFNLWLPLEIGKFIVASATLTFIFMIISGIILWIPKSLKNLKNRLFIKWNARWRRKNYDLHYIPGFYTFIIGLVFAITGLVWGFEWFMNSYYYVISGGDNYIAYEEPISEIQNSNTDNLEVIDKIYMLLKNENPDNYQIEVHIPENEYSSIETSVNPTPSTYWNIDYRYFDQYTMKELSVEHLWGRFEETSRGQKLMRMNYDIHIGSILGLPGKIIAFLISLVIASLPITGFLIWWGRRNKQKRS